jgi:Transcriptional regulators
MIVTAKQIAEQLGLSEAAVSMALHQKPGVSTQTRKRVIETARTLGYDFTKITPAKPEAGVICILFFNRNQIFDNPFFTELVGGIESSFNNTNYRLMIKHINSDDDVTEQLNELIASGCDGIILLGTEMEKADFAYFSFLDIPIVLLDSYFDSSKMDCILINNLDGARLATNYLIKKRNSQPGYLKSSCPIHNFDDRAEGFYRAIRQHGYSASQCIVHLLSPNIESAYHDMMEILDKGEPVANCYFADNDDIAIGAMKAFKEKGYRIPENVAFIGFDNTSVSRYVEPPLTTVNVPKAYMGKMAAERMLSILHTSEFQPIKIEINTTLVIRKSITV